MIISVGSWRGVGATTTALLLAAAIAVEEPAWFIEADPAGGVLGGRIPLAPHEIGGLEQIAFTPSGSGPSARFDQVAHTLRQLRIVASPADPFRAHACHTPRTPWQSMLRELDGDVVVDVGTLRAGSPAWRLVGSGDVLVLAMSPEVSAAVSTVEWVRAAGRVAPGIDGVVEMPVLLAVVDAPCGVAFPMESLRSEVPEHWGAWLAWEPETVDLVHRGASFDDRRLRRSALGDGVRQLLRSVRESMAVLR